MDSSGVGLNIERGNSGDSGEYVFHYSAFFYDNENGKSGGGGSAGMKRRELGM